ncbi:MAG: hypothetical protein LBE31_11690, partial [Deltaproteobacteria bacterium]|nr:hypothetical protein [Deltaproteobacteria bacterium]
ADWVFFLDADERFTPELIKSVKSFISQNQVQGQDQGQAQAQAQAQGQGQAQTQVQGQAQGLVWRQNHAFGRKHRFGHLAPDRVKRLFPKGSVKWSRAVHECPECQLPVKLLEGFLEHHTYQDWDRYLAKFIHDARLWADEEYKNGRKTTALGAVLHGGAAFFKMFFLKLGILEGPVGWALCWYYGGYTLSKYLLLMQKRKDA